MVHSDALMRDCLVPQAVTLLQCADILQEVCSSVCLAVPCSVLWSIRILFGLELSIALLFNELPSASLTMEK